MATSLTSPWAMMTPEEQQAALAAQKALGSTNAQMGANALPLSSVSQSTTETIQDPALQALYSKKLADYEKMSADARAQDEAGIQSWRDKLKAYTSEEQPVDFRAIAPIIDQWSASQGMQGSASKIADTFAPESKKDRDAKTMALMEKIQGSEQALSKTQLDALKNQLASLGMAIGQQTRKETSAAKSAETESRFNRLLDRDVEKDVQNLAKETANKADLDSALAAVNKTLGFDFKKYDPLTETVDGKKIDLPGASIPGVGRVAFYDKRARMLEDSMSRVFNTVLKDRSGAAVTTTELDRLKNEFSSGRFQSEGEKIGALQRYEDLLNKELNRRESAFTEQARSTYKKRVGSTTNKMSSGPTVPAGGLSNKDQQRLEELRKKLGK